MLVSMKDMLQHALRDGYAVGQFNINNLEWVGAVLSTAGNDSNLLIVFYVQIMPDDLVMQLHRF